MKNKIIILFLFIACVSCDKQDTKPILSDIDKLVAIIKFTPINKWCFKVISNLSGEGRWSIYTIIIKNKQTEIILTKLHNNKQLALESLVPLLSDEKYAWQANLCLAHIFNGYPMSSHLPKEVNIDSISPNISTIPMNNSLKKRDDNIHLLYPSFVLKSLPEFDSLVKLSEETDCYTDFDFLNFWKSNSKTEDSLRWVEIRQNYRDRKDE
jgi:hypothetical protein